MAGPPISRFAWRNLWRNKRRTLLTLVAISFGLFLAVFMTALQDRSFGDMIDMAARMRSGHVAVQHRDQLDAPSLSNTVADADRLAARLREVEGVTRAVPRIRGPMMIATAGHSYGALFQAVDPGLEDDQTLAWFDDIVAGEMLDGPDGRGIL
ncbi:MAG: hypothetical protein D6798_16970, partial [Deltaproteobacteria bacterium]